MAASSLEVSNLAPRHTETELLAALAQEEPDLTYISLAISHYRLEANKIIMDNLQLAQEHDLEQTLWTRHVEVSKLFKKAIRVLEKEGKTVEYRKTVKSYHRFLIGAMMHYRGYIQSLLSKYGRIPELDEVASVFAVNKNTVMAPEESCPMARLSCHQTLIFLGDLSRYREEASRKESNWSYALGYYGLAQAIHPSSGTSHHQYAVIARSMGSHLEITYHLYRSVAVKEPDPRARDSLELEMKKIVKAHEKGTLHSERHSSSIPMMMLLHSHLYKCDDMAGQDELENDMLSQLLIDLKVPDFDTTLQRIALTNIAAQYFAGIRFQDCPNDLEHKNAFICFLRLNLKTYIMLLEVLRQELTMPINGVSDDDGNDNEDANSLRKMSAVMRRIFPSLRHYSSWLRSNTKVIVGCLHFQTLQDLINGFFKMYFETLTLLASTFPADLLSTMEYLLQEDEATIAFEPFAGAQGRYLEVDGSLKRKIHGSGIRRNHPNVEMFGRIRDLLDDAHAVALRDDVPFHWTETTESPMEPPTETMPISTKPHKPEIDAIARFEGHISDPMPKTPESTSSVPIFNDAAMEDMVNELVNSEPLPKGSPTPDFGPIGTPPRRSSGQNSAVNTPLRAGNETSYGVIGTPTAQELARKLSPYSSMETSPQPRLPENHVESSQGHKYPHATSGTQIIESSISSIQTPSSIGMQPQRGARTMCTHSPRNQPSIWHHERRSSAAQAYQSSQFMSSNLLSGSTYNGSRQAAMYQTPPNGQGDP